MRFNKKISVFLTSILGLAFCSSVTAETTFVSPIPLSVILDLTASDNCVVVEVKAVDFGKPSSFYLSSLNSYGSLSSSYSFWGLVE